MPMSTTLFAVTEETMKRLEAKPDSIGDFESKEKYDTYLWQSLPYFLTSGDDAEDGDDDEDEEEEEEDEDDEDDVEEHPLDAVLTGDRTVKCKQLENGAFYTLTASRVVELSALLAAVKPLEVKKRVLAADLEEALDGELYEELEQLDLTEPDAAAAQVVKDLKALVKFYDSAAKQKLGIVLYTT